MNHHNFKHGFNKHPAMAAIRAAIYRCYDKNSKLYHRYGGRGVTVCQEWINNPSSFVIWSLANGWEKGLQIDKDILSNKIGLQVPSYSPDTCMWVEAKNNQNEAHNKNVYQFTIDGMFVAIFDSISDANEYLNKPRKHGGIGNVLAGRRKTALGYKWEYSDD